MVAVPYHRQAMLQADADRVAQAFDSMATAVASLRAFGVSIEWLAACLRDAAVDARDHIDRAADEAGETVDWRRLDLAVDQIQGRPPDNVVQLRLL